MSDTTAGVITDSQREYLRMDDAEREETYERQVRYRFRERIKTRLTNLMVRDFPILASHLDEELLEHVFKMPDQDELEDGSAAFWSGAGIPPALRFLIQSTQVNRQTPNIALGLESVLETFNSHFEKAIKRYLIEEQGVVADISVSYEADNIRPQEDFIQELEEREEPVTGAERIEMAGILQRIGVSEDEMIELLGPQDGDGDEHAEE